MPPKKNKVTKSDVVVKCAPDSTVDGFDWKKIDAEIRKVDIKGLMWASQFPLENFVFGLKVMMVGCQIEDVMVPSTAPIAEALQKIEGIDSAEVVNIQTAQEDWAKLQAKAGGGKKKKNKKKKKKGPVYTITPQDIEDAAAKVCMLARESEVYVTGVPGLDRSGALNVTEEQLKKVVDGVKAKRPDLLFALVSAGETTCTACGFIPDSYADKPGSDAVAMLNAGFMGEAKATGDKQTAYCEMTCNVDDGQFPIKMKDNVMTQLFAYFNSSGLCPDSDSEYESSSSSSSSSSSDDE